MNKPPISYPLRLLVLCWGYSVHAYRRTQLFVNDSRFQVTVVSPYNYRFKKARNVVLLGNMLQRRYYLPSLLITAVRDYIILKRAVDDFAPDLILLQTLLYPCYLAYLLPKTIPQVVSFWNGDVVWWAKWNGIERLFKKQLLVYGAKRAKAITAHTNFVAKACLNYDIKKDKVYKLPYPGVNMQIFTPESKKAARNKLGIKHRWVVLWPRGIAEYLNFDIFLKSAFLLLSSRPNILFIMLSNVGSHKASTYRKKIAAKNLEGNFRWEFQVDWESMPDYYAASDVMVSISSNDSLPNVMLESMACKTPVVVGDIPAIREWVKNRSTGFLTPINNTKHLAKTIDFALDPANAQLVRKITKRALELVRRKVDSKKNTEKIKRLILKVARNNTV